MLKLFAVVVALLALTFGGLRSALAGPATDVVKAKQTALFDLLKVSSPENEKKVSAVFDEMLDYAALSEASLGSEWAPRTDAEKAQFSDLLKQLVRQAYQRNLKKFIKSTVDYYSEEQVGGAYMVKTKAKSKTDAREKPIGINFKMLQKDNKWRVNDIVTDGVSLVSSYRTLFTKIIKKDGFPMPIQKMKDKLAKGSV